MKVLITGAAGYVGSVCTEALIERGHSLIALDDLSEGHRESLDPRAQFCKVNLHDRDALDEVFRTTEIDAVMHFAALCLGEHSVKEPGRYYRANVSAGINLLDAMLRHRVKKLIFSSTAATYGEPEINPIPEEHRTKPINPYGASKLLFERILEEFESNSGIEYVTMRYFNAAGASQSRGEDHHPETHILPILFEAALGQRDAFQIYGTDYPTPERISWPWKKFRKLRAGSTTSAIAGDFRSARSSTQCAGLRAGRFPSVKRRGVRAIRPCWWQVRREFGAS